MLVSRTARGATGGGAACSHCPVPRWQLHELLEQSPVVVGDTFDTEYRLDLGDELKGHDTQGEPVHLELKPVFSRGRSSADRRTCSRCTGRYTAGRYTADNLCSVGSATPLSQLNRAAFQSPGPGHTALDTRAGRATDPLGR